MTALSQILKVLAFLVPLAFPLLVLFTSARLGFWWRSGLVASSAAASLPVSFIIMLLAHDPALFSHDHINPGIGVAAIPVMIEWMMVFIAVICTITILIVTRIYSKLKR
jgi:hypothetical protein